MGTPKPVTVNGTTYDSRKDACAALGITAGALHYLIKMHGSTIRRYARRGSWYASPVDVAGVHYASIWDACAALHISPNAVRRRVVFNGWDIETALAAPVGGTWRDHLGHEYASLRKMAAAWNIPAPTLYNRIALYGWPIDRALTQRRRGGGRKRKDRT